MIDNRKEVQDSLSAVESVFEITVLMDFYGQLLTDRQYEIMDLHYNSDLSLGEIAEELNVSRQAVFDGVRKARQTLENYEKRLGLVERFREQERNIDKALRNLKSLEKKSPELVKDQNYQAAVELLGKIKDTL
ncbi:MAG: YlxM family DNA-binding protein [Clostridiaceae bacterium]|nr:YlxM family DNA-binding protein [Clostridiaceae bacterium]